MAFIHVYQNRSSTRIIQIKDADGNVITPDQSDKIRAIIGRAGQLGTDLADAALVLTSDDPVGDNSHFVKNEPTDGKNTLRLASQELAAIKPGVYTLFIDYLDHADQDEWKNVQRHTISIERTD